MVNSKMFMKVLNYEHSLFHFEFQQALSKLRPNHKLRYVILILQLSTKLK